MNGFGSSLWAWMKAAMSVFKFLDAAMDAALDLLVGQQREPAFDLVQPGSAGWCATTITVAARVASRKNLTLHKASLLRPRDRSPRSRWSRRSAAWPSRCAMPSRGVAMSGAGRPERRRRTLSAGAQTTPSRSFPALLQARTGLPARPPRADLYASANIGAVLVSGCASAGPRRHARPSTGCSKTHRVLRLGP